MISEPPLVFVFMSSLPKSDETKCESGRQAVDGRTRMRQRRRGVNFLVAITEGDRACLVSQIGRVSEAQAVQRAAAVGRPPFSC